ncbi:MAG: nucleotidyltransferase domain-containing protein [archaeon]
MLKISRSQILDLLKKLESDKNIYAIWLEGSDAQNRADKYSDIDIWIDVSDNYVSKAFNLIEKLLKSLGDLDFAYETEHNHPKIRQKFFHIKNTSEFFIIDVCVQKHSRVFWYTSNFKDEKIKTVFDKCNVVKFKKLNKKRFEKENKQKLLKLKSTFMFYQVWVKKEINRNHFLEALFQYHEKVLKPLVELIRIKYEPTKSSFYLKDISYDIPKKYTKILEDLYKINSINDISKKLKKANKLYYNLI